MSKGIAEALGAALASGALKELRKQTPQNYREILAGAEVAARRIIASKKKNPFNEGDYVTPRENCGLKGSGTPHVVAEIFDQPFRFLGGDDSGDTSYGDLLDMRVVTVIHGQDIAWMAASWRYEHWTPPAEGEKTFPLDDVKEIKPGVYMAGHKAMLAMIEDPDGFQEALEKHFGQKVHFDPLPDARPVSL